MKDIQALNKEIKLKSVTIGNEQYYKITNHNEMRPFFMSIVSDSNHWMFISSNGGLTAGRKDSENALFPYYTDDKVTELNDVTGSKSIFWVTVDNQAHLWEPFSDRQEGQYNYSRNIYKNRFGNKLLFEEVNHDLNLTFRYQWCSSNQYGFVRKSTLINHSEAEVNVKLLDGIQNIMPYGVNTDLQAIRSNLVDAYKRSEIQKETGIGIYSLSAIIVDRAEPSEALKANMVWSLGIKNPQYLASSLQLDAFRNNASVKEENDIKAEKGAYFLVSEMSLPAESQKQWMIIANVNQTISAISAIAHKIKNNDNLKTQVNNDIQLGTQRLMNLVSASDGFQLSADKRRNTRHYSNTLFNIMRGGIFDLNYLIEKWDFDTYLAKANKKIHRTTESILEKLPEVFSLQKLKELAVNSDDKNFRRLAMEYMPLKFSRRHGDPSRPWNKFSINTRNEDDGSKILDYEGNWRDIFQNWEALAYSYPEFLESMIHKFLNATTFDGYNPYRVTKDGFDWEVIEEHDPWSYIGYWGDHQIIYLLKFLEAFQDHYPNMLDDYFTKDLFVYANVPYKIKPYQEIVKDPKDTIEFDYDLDKQIRKKRDEFGADGALLRDENYFIHKVNFLEKILATTLAKLSNFIPEGGIWMNTQRPEWNDANNALVGNGVSMVTLYYLRRFFKFFEHILKTSETQDIELSKELLEFFNQVNSVLIAHSNVLSSKISDADRKTVTDGLGEAGSQYRSKIYNHSFSGRKETISVSKLTDFVALTLQYLEHSIKANKRADNMYHAYNLMTIDNNGISISYLDEMLEGQVAALSSGYLKPKESLAVLDSMKNSKLFRPDQYSYLLYPNKELPKFLEKNTIPTEKVEASKLLTKLIHDGNTNVLEQDIDGNYHFNGNFNNANSLNKALDALANKGYQDLVAGERKAVLQTFEDVFNHKAFTGRSGTFYGYEGLGSIYWHMVSKLLLAVQECCLQAINLKESDETIGRLLEHYYEINEGIGVHKSPKLYGAFPTDPYSHTPLGKGAQQPGMTGQVKEDILSRMGELGVVVENGNITFNPVLLRADEFLKDPKTFVFVDVNQNKQELQVYRHELAFTYCQVPIVYAIASKNSVDITYSDGRMRSQDNLTLGSEISKALFNRTAEVAQIKVHIKKDVLK
ncbi:hypothetical protein [Mangrovimonas spongiae]|uniref:Cellobiose phosphorylase n=1 Tax=Mangrovimonas spongiae TaxID=2494697 RepID=A0A428K591_9FLAO|nr:hypothetical protein [Mangrovimonas spongiae]RSK41430.1 hypothetical protein EJA19_00725 [Mangrovimonas spongiae]